MTAFSSWPFLILIKDSFQLVSQKCWGWIFSPTYCNHNAAFRTGKLAQIYVRSQYWQFKTSFHISKSIYCKAVPKTQDTHFYFDVIAKKIQNLKGFHLVEIWKKKNLIISELTKDRTALLNPSFTCISKSFILVPCWMSWLLSSFSSFCTNSAAALFFWVRREAQIALYSTVLSSLGFPLGLSITPTRTPGLAFCLHTHTHTQTQQWYNSHKDHTFSYFHRLQVSLRESTGRRECWLLKSNSEGFSYSARNLFFKYRMPACLYLCFLWKHTRRKYIFGVNLLSFRS